MPAASEGKPRHLARHGWPAAGGEPKANTSVLRHVGTLGWEAFGFGSGDELSRQRLNKHTYSAPGVLPHKRFRWMHPHGRRLD